MEVLLEEGGDGLTPSFVALQRLGEAINVHAMQYFSKSSAVLDGLIGTLPLHWKHRMGSITKQRDMLHTPVVNWCPIEQCAVTNGILNVAHHLEQFWCKLT
jgi:hypothetical protein